MSSARAVRHPNDPDRYIRRMKNKYQARPYDTITQERHDLGLFATQGEARIAIQDFWWGKRNDTARFTRAYYVRRNGAKLRLYMVIVPWQREMIVLKGFENREMAAAAVRGLLRGLMGPLFAEAALRRS